MLTSNHWASAIFPVPPIRLSAIGNTYTVGGDIDSDGALNGGTSSFTMSSAAGQLSGSAGTVFYDFIVTGSITMNIDFSVAHNFTNNNTFDASIGMLIMVGTGPSSIGGTASPYTLAQFAVQKSASATATLAKNVTGVTDLHLYSGTLDASTFSITQDAGGGTLSIEDRSFLSIEGSFIHVSNGAYPVAGLLSVNNNARNTNPSTVFLGIPGSEGPSPLVRLNAAFADETTASDPVVVYFKEGTTGVFNNKMDALKLMNTDPQVPSLYAISSDAARLSIKAVSYFPDSTDILPLGLSTKKAGWVTFNAPSLERIPDGLHIYLSDAATGIKKDLERDPAYRLYLNAGDYEGRFSLIFGRKDTIYQPANAEFNAYGAGGRMHVYLDLAPGEKGGLIIRNILGQVVWRRDIVSSGHYESDTGFIKWR